MDTLLELVIPCIYSVLLNPPQIYVISTGMERACISLSPFAEITVAQIEPSNSNQPRLALTTKKTNAQPLQRIQSKSAPP
jgi:hypothetical protein